MYSFLRSALHAALTALLLLTAGCAGETDDPVRMLTGGIRHESNTFIPIHTTEADFTIRRGVDALEDQPWAVYLQEEDVDVVPTVHAYASPFGVVAAETYERFKQEILDGLREAGTVDAVYLDMHGALHVEGYDDAQLDLVRSVRELAGPAALIGASFDLHGNLSASFVDELDMMTAYRTAPHVDGDETRVRAVRRLLEAVREGLRPVIAHVNVPILIPGEKGITSVEPLKSLYEQLPEIEGREGLVDASIFVGMPWTDVHRAGMSVQVVAEGERYRGAAEEEARRLAEALWDRRHELKFDVPTAGIDEAIRIALNAPESTVFITDSGDNTTAGAAGDNPLVVERLLAHGVDDAVVAGVVDPQAVQQCEEAGVGASVNLVVGGRLDTVFGEPLEVTGTVRYVTPPDARSGEPGPLEVRPAVVDLGGVLLVLLNRRRSFTSPADFEAVNINPLDHKIVVVKLGYLFQGLRDIAPRTIMALTPGFAYQVVENLPYEQVRRPIYPLDPDMTWAP
ncbi:MAG: M81 family metallopeptidase [Rhodothermales bacterium]